jgi:ABC-type Fe3+-hydroxamate transport system substrate-binding protein
MKTRINEKKHKGEFSIWLMPENNIYKKLSNLISLLSEEYSCPDFQPHVTLIGKIIGKREKVI